MKVQLEIICRGMVTVEVADEKRAEVEALGSYCDLDDFEAASGVDVDLGDINITKHPEVNEIDILESKKGTTGNSEVHGFTKKPDLKKPKALEDDED
jgi:hypothetical protein